MFCLAVLPKPCLHDCTCHRSPRDRVNIFDCRNKGLTSLPQTVLEDTDWLLLSGNNLGSLNKAPDYLRNISLLDLSSNNITDKDEKMMEVIITNVKHLNIRNNKLKTLPRTTATVNGTSVLMISDNPYECNCDIIWMKDWLIDSPDVQDKDNVICSTGKMKGKVTLTCRASNYY